jgi:hypothetical protein
LVVQTEEGTRLRVSENREKRRMFRPNRDEITKEWRELDNEKLNEFYSSLNTVWMIK